LEKAAFNPFLPSYEYIPDGEPRLFGGRVYLYGSHDRFDGKGFCLNDYVCWSAPADDLADWRYEGTIYRRTQDPLNADGRQHLFAPDAVRGPDGKYYLYYALNMSSVISAAVCDEPAGRYEFLGHVRCPDGHVLGTRRGEVHNFDPGVLVDDDGRVYLYTGFAPAGALSSLLKLSRHRFDGAWCVELEPDMVTVKSGPVRVAPGPGLSKGTGFEGHAFFEASSMRKVGPLYCFIYSSELSHELCYATGNSPQGPFRYGGTLVSIGDIGLDGNTKPRNYLGNTHGSVAKIGDSWYVFYHRQTNGHQYSRQACAERIELRADGSFAQAETTSCGLNGGPLPGKGTFEARIACSLTGPDGAAFSRFSKKRTRHPYFTQTGADRENDPDQYIANMQNGAQAGFKYFSFDGSETELAVRVRCSGTGVMQVTRARTGGVIARADILPSETGREFTSRIKASEGVQALFFTYQGSGKADFLSFTIR